MYQGIMDQGHLLAAVRIALGAYGYQVSPADLDRAARSRWHLGCQLRDQILPDQFPTFVATEDYHRLADIDAYFWSRLPHIAGFGYQQTALLHGLVTAETELKTLVATLGAAFNVGIALLDYLTDEHQQGALLFETLNRNVVSGMFTPGDSTSLALECAYGQVEDPRTRLLFALVGTCEAGFRELYRQSGNDIALANLAHMIGQLYQSEQTVSFATASPREMRRWLPDIEAKSVLPAVAMLHIATLSTVLREAPKVAQLVGTTFGHIAWRSDDLIDLLTDCRRGAPSGTVLRLADLLTERCRTFASDADLYDVIDVSAAELLELLSPATFGYIDRGSFIHATGATVHDESVAHDATSEALAEALDFARIAVAGWVEWQGASDGPTSIEPTALGMSETIRNATIAASRMILVQERGGYHEAIHHLRFPRVYPEGVRYESHRALLFQRAIMLDGLLDAYFAGHSVDSSVLYAEALTILKAKHRDVRGGWNYIPEVPELPTDADDLGMILQVLYRVGGPSLASICDEAIQLALDAAGPNGGFSTWILDDPNRSLIDKTMHDYIRVIGGLGVHPDVVANLVYGLILYDATRYQDALVGGITYLEEAQGDLGAWSSKWYAGPYYGTYRAVSVLGLLTPGSHVLARAQTFLVQSQRLDGSWGEDSSDPLATALAMLALIALGMRIEDAAIHRGASYLSRAQEPDGGWARSPFISFPTAEGLEIYASRTITTTFCLKALLATQSAANSRQEQRSGQAGFSPPPPFPSLAPGWT
ncbi:MAG TPA: hypothetical protein VLA19_11990 [Herpetosiphonaceae bacterium]|nr:hypothetical protein [Herpetosiphonaceae bacterium]